MVDSALKILAFFLPQYHPIPENDSWWGRGFTEWTNVARARPLFGGHYQPHIPADLGFYDLRLPEVRQAQADLAREHGIYGFCYYHYWFTGKRVLERPFNEVLSSGEPDFPFCLCWANENWTRAWDGGDHQLLLSQVYSKEDDVAHIKSLIPAFRDKRYIKIDGKPVFLIYRTEKIPDILKTVDIWRKEISDAGFPGLYLIRVEGFVEKILPQSIGFDASVEFAPDWRTLKQTRYHHWFYNALSKLGLFPEVYMKNWIVDYQDMVNYMLSKPEVDYLRFRCATPSFDNSTRRSRNAAIYINSTPEKYGAWLRGIVKRAMKNHENEQIVFINAWNEWGEGNHLEPDQKWGRAYLEATRQALD